MAQEKQYVYKVLPKYVLPEEQEEEVLTHIQKTLEKKGKLSIVKMERLGIGQNINYKVFIEQKDTPAYLLRIISRKGYPSLETLKECYRLLQEGGIETTQPFYIENKGDIVPYGFFLQPWIEGIDGVEKFESQQSNQWVIDFANLLKEVHKIKLPYYGALGSGPKYSSLKAYFEHMEEVIETSFGEVFEERASIWELDIQGVTSKGFLQKTFQKVREEAEKFTSPIPAVLIHGDMFPQNLIYSTNGCFPIDWDETRATWFGYEIARTLFFAEEKEIGKLFFATYGMGGATKEEINIGIRLEHIRQLLRTIMMTTFQMPKGDGLRERVKELERAIEEKWEERFI